DWSAPLASRPARTSICRSTSTVCPSILLGSCRALNRLDWNAAWPCLRRAQSIGGDAMVNKVLLVGNLTADPDVKATPKGTYIANLRLATNTYAGKDEAGNAKKHAEFHNLVAFGHTAEFAGQYLRKGRTLYVEGR